MEIRKVPISLLNAAPYNPRKDLQPGDPEYQKIARSIEKYGCVEPIIWNERTGNVIGGHQRLKVLAATGAVEVDVSVVQLSLEDEKALNLALNKISGQWDNEKLSAVLQDLSAGFDVEVTGFDQHEVDALVASFAESGHEYELPGSEPYINNFFDSGVQAKPKAEEPAAAPAPEAPAQDAEMHPNAAPAPNEVQAVQPGGKRTSTRVVASCSDKLGTMTVFFPPGWTACTSLCLICLNRMQPPSWTFSRTWALRTVWRMRHDTVCDMRTSDGGLSLLAGG